MSSISSGAMSSKRSYKHRAFPFAASLARVSTQVAAGPRLRKTPLSKPFYANLTGILDSPHDAMKYEDRSELKEKREDYKQEY